MAKTLKDAKQELIYVRDKLYDSLSTAEENGKQKGKKEERDEFWRIMQNNGNAQNYNYAFALGRFNDYNYNPQFDIVCSAGSGAQYMFYSSPITNTKVPIYANAKNLNLQGTFQQSSITTIKKLIVSETTSYRSTFANCFMLANIEIEGVIGQSIDFSSCPLNLESAKSVLTHLKYQTEYEGNAESPYSILLSSYTWELLDAEHEPPESGYMPWRSYLTQRGWSY